METNEAFSGIQELVLTSFYFVKTIMAHNNIHKFCQIIKKLICFMIFVQDETVLNIFFSGAGTSAEISGLKGISEKREGGGGEVCTWIFKGLFVNFVAI